MYRDHNCGELNIKNVNEVVMLAGWVQRMFKELEIWVLCSLLI